MNTPYDQLLRLIAALESDQTVPRDVAAWLLQGIESYRECTVSSLDEALALDAESGGYFKRPHVAEKYSSRSRMIKTIVSTMTGTDKDKATQLACLIKSRDPSLQQLFELGVNVPESPRQLLRIIRSRE